MSWRKEACQILDQLNFNGIVYVPEFSTWKSKEHYVDQALWEREALTGSTVIVFWIPRSFPDMPAFTTNVEFGYWLHSGKVIYGRPIGALKTKYLDWLYQMDYGKEPIADLKVLLEKSLLLCEQLFDGKQYQIFPLEQRLIMKKR